SWLIKMTIPQTTKQSPISKSAMINQLQLQIDDLKEREKKTDANAAELRAKFEKEIRESIEKEHIAEREKMQKLMEEKIKEAVDQTKLEIRLQQETAVSKIDMEIASVNKKLNASEKLTISIEHDEVKSLKKDSERISYEYDKLLDGEEKYVKSDKSDGESDKSDGESSDGFDVVKINKE
ncbi:MAG: hypothetical protein AAB467_01595, partial [Patescibacteria group bacterium]